MKHIIIRTVGGLFIAAILSCMAYLWVDCNAQGGDLVRTMFWYRCMK